jgi:DNA mismatch repair ATPase MutS
MQSRPCTCYIDEILRGTNTIERIAASAAVLKYIHMQNSLIIAASHDIELTSILAGDYDNYHFSEQITQEGVQFDYKLKEGPSKTRNAIKLLSSLGFDQAITDHAYELAKGYETNKTW